jgi:hypothetical protein
MKTKLILLVLCAALLSATTAWTQPAPAVENIHRGLELTVKVPPAWDGIWSYSDSIFTCAMVLQSVTSGVDTLCAGADFLVTQTGYTCTGTADATTIDLTCTYTYDVLPDCQSNTVTTIRGTLTGDTYSSITTSNTTFTGTGCGPIPPLCSIVHQHSTRTGPAPAEYCAAATVPVTWGKIKDIYR